MSECERMAMHREQETVTFMGCRETGLVRRVEEEE
jgi:hypothetical protein